MLMRTALTQSLEELSEMLIRMGALTSGAAWRATQAFETGQEEPARKILADDEAIRALRGQIASGCVALLACQQPVAGDLDQIILSARLSTEFDQIRRLSVQVAEATLDTGQPPPAFLKDLYALSQTAGAMVTEAVTVYAEAKPQSAEEVVAMDTRMHSLFEAAKASLASYARSQPDAAQTAMNHLLAVKYLERMGFHATSIASCAADYHTACRFAPRGAAGPQGEE